MCGISNHPRTLKNESLQAVQRNRLDLMKRRLLSRATSKVCKDGLVAIVLLKMVSEEDARASAVEDTVVTKGL